MESGTEVLRVVAAIVTAFQTAAEVLEHIKDRKEKKKRKRDKEAEELLEIKILHKSLLQGGVQCRRHCENRQSRYSPAFENGDAIALPALKDVVIALQTEVIQGLHLARAVETATLDFTTLHEASVTCRKDATRAMDQLCERIMISLQYQSPQPDEQRSEEWSRSEFRVRYGSPSIPQSLALGEIPPETSPQLPSEKRLPSLPGALGHAGRVIYQPIQRVLPQRAITIHRSSDAMSRKSRVPASSPIVHMSALNAKASNSQLSWTSSRRSASSDVNSSAGATSSFVQTAPTSPEVSHSNSDRVHSPRLDSIADEQLLGQGASGEVDPKRASMFSIQPSVFTLGGETDLERSSHNSTASIVTHRTLRNSSTGEHPPVTSDRTVTQQHYDTVGNDYSEGFDAKNGPSSTRLIDRSQATHDSILTQQKSRHARSAALSSIPPAFNFDRSTPQGTVQQPPVEDLTPESSSQAHFTIDGGAYIEIQPASAVRNPESRTTFPMDQRKETEARDPRALHERPSCTTLQSKDALPPPSSSAAISSSAGAFNDVKVDSKTTSPPKTLVTPDESWTMTLNQDIPRYQVANKGAPYTTSEATERMKRDESTIVSPNSEKLDELTPASPPPEPMEVGWDAQFTEKLRPVPDYANEKFSASLTQADYQERLASLPKGLENVWLPLARPALHNRYHGFCKGAWQIRKAADEGLRVLLTPNAREPILHWQCMSCEFRCKAPTADSLPDHVLFNQKYNIRYRWLFLAKSHRSASTPLSSPDSYAYGCIFCAAQGHVSAAHERLEHLLVHIMAKHKASMMTPEIKAKAKCITGGSLVPSQGQQDWDVMVPEAHVKSVGTAADELRISAGKFWGRRKGKK